MYKCKKLFSVCFNIKEKLLNFRTGFFVLTPEYGLDFIANCRESGFHPHPTDIPLYTVSINII